MAVVRLRIGDVGGWMGMPDGGVAARNEPWIAGRKVVYETCLICFRSRRWSYS